MGKIYEYTGENPQFSFIADLNREMHARMPVGWGSSPTGAGRLDLSRGIALIKEFPDPLGRLDTAYTDFDQFLTCAGLENGAIPLRIIFEPTGQRETHAISTALDGVTLSAGDTEGVRRGLVWLEDELCRQGGPALPYGTIRRRAAIQTRISRCFYGPIKRYRLLS